MAGKLDLETARKLSEELEKTISMESDGSLEGLSEQQQLIFRLRSRGMSLQSIGNAVGVSKTYVHKILAQVKEIQGRSITERTVAEHVGEAISIYGEVEQEALQIMDGSKDPNIKLKAMSTIMTARDKQVKLLMDLGYMERVAQKTETNLTVQVLQGWDAKLRQQLSATIIESQLQDLEDPVPMLEGEIVPPARAKSEEEQLAELVGYDEEDDDE